MQFVNIHTAKTHFSKLVDMVVHGNEVIIAMAGRPVAILSPISKKTKLRFGVLKGKMKIAKDFDAPLPEKVLKDFGE
jgi:prevent-host-death family protein